MNSVHGPHAEISNQRLSIEYKPIESLTPNPNNPRKHTKKQIQKIARSIQDLGFVNPVVIKPGGEVVEGHGRLQAARLLQLNEIPTISPQHLNENQLTALMIADNRLCEQSRWNKQLLGEHLKALAAVEINFSLEATGFELDEIGLLIENPQPGTEIGPVSEALTDVEHGVPVTVPGDLWQLESNRILCGNAAEADNYSRLMRARKANVILADPPASFTPPLDLIFNLLISHSAEGSIHFVFAGSRRMEEILMAGKQRTAD